MSKSDAYKPKLYNVEEVKELLSKVIDDDLLITYTAKDIQDIFHLESIDSARRLMNHPAFPSMQIGRKKIVTKGNLKKFIKANQNYKIELS